LTGEALAHTGVGRVGVEPRQVGGARIPGIDQIEPARPVRMEDRFGKVTLEDANLRTYAATRQPREAKFTHLGVSGPPSREPDPPPPIHRQAVWQLAPDKLGHHIADEQLDRRRSTRDDKVGHAELLDPRAE